jgi:hypothetical protein
MYVDKKRVIRHEHVLLPHTMQLIEQVSVHDVA